MHPFSEIWHRVQPASHLAFGSIGIARSFIRAGAGLGVTVGSQAVLPRLQVAVTICAAGGELRGGGGGGGDKREPSQPYSFPNTIICEQAEAGLSMMAPRRTWLRGRCRTAACHLQPPTAWSIRCCDSLGKQMGIWRHSHNTQGSDRYAGLWSGPAISKRVYPPPSPPLHKAKFAVST